MNSPCHLSEKLTEASFVCPEGSSELESSAGCYYRPDPAEGPQQLKVSMTTLPEGVLPSLLSMETNIFNTSLHKGSESLLLLDLCFL